MTEEQALELRPYLERAVRSIQRNLPAHVEFDDLQSAAWLRVLRDSERLGSDPKALKPYLGNMVRWAIQDFGRGEDPNSRHAERAQTISLDFALDDGPIIQVEDKTRDAELIEHRRTIKELFRRARLGYRNSRIIRDYFLNQLSFVEVGEKYGIHQSRVSQIITWGLDRLRAVKPRMTEPISGQLELVCPCGKQFCSMRPRRYCSSSCQGRLAVPHKQSKLPDARELRRMYVELGMTTRQIAAACGLTSRSGLIPALKSAGIRTRPNFKAQALGFDLEGVLRLRRQGKPYYEIVKLLGGNVSAMKMAVCRHNQRIKKARALEPQVTFPRSPSLPRLL